MNPGLMIPGIAFDFGGGRVFTLPPLSLGALELLQGRMDKVAELEVTHPQAIAVVIDATHMAFVRNYPAMSRAEVAELIDLGNMGEVYQCVMDVSGVKRRALAAEAEAGNVMAVSLPIGGDSLPASAPTPDGTGSTSAST